MTYGDKKKILQPFFMGIAILLFVTWTGVPAELKPMLANPDKGLRTVLAQWEKKLIKRNSKLKYEFRVHRNYEDANGKKLKVSST